jgi:hypothetical protein
MMGIIPKKNILAILIKLTDFFKIIFIYLWYGISTQGFMLARQALYHLNHSSSPNRFLKLQML